MLDKGDLDPQQTDRVLGMLLKILEMQAARDTENKGFLSSLSKPMVLAGVALAGVVTLVVVKPEALAKVGNALRGS